MRLIALTIACCLVQLSFGQKFSGILSFNAGVPVGEFKDVSNKTATGLRLNFLYRPSDMAPVYIGLETGYQVRSSKTWHFDAYGNGYYDHYSVNAGSNVFSIFFNTRLQLPGWAAVMPFIDGMFGFNDFYSGVHVNGYSDNGDDGAVYSAVSKARWTLAYGGSAGVDFVINKRGTLWLEVKMSYTLGQRNIYLVDPKVDEAGNVTFTEKSSETDMLIPQAGIKFDF